MILKHLMTLERFQQDKEIIIMLDDILFQKVL